MTAHPSDRPDGARPSVAEIAALTRRLWELSTPGRAVDPGERAAFLADKDALITRITDSNAATDTDAATGRERHQHIARIGRTDQSADPTVQAVTFDVAGYYTDAHLAAIAQARAGGDTERLQDAPWSASAEDERVPAMPDWMREQARRTEAAIPDGTYVPGPPDDLARFTDRLAALRGQTVEDDPARREQLAHWHTDDTADTLDADDVHQEPGGPRSATDDGPGLP
ncbi:hypothetical protein [Pseudonocardia broussonetiae]|uniref:Uncharacterized protein n=1 Tax=Pseudonocardia broussonetiae TaxID=2736640 RepID=A0A6M6JFH7_9PSEU|nr:hypothetical protein [Pseudonocardia broussonetiae]QJY45542.1 hypothetical protein HOP40_06760 [Pseudonocardia broussonetiae]